jgi:hypothetical protein
LIPTAPPQKNSRHLAAVFFINRVPMHRKKVNEQIVLVSRNNILVKAEKPLFSGILPLTM